MAHALSAHETPPQYMKDIFKKYQKIKPTDIDTDTGILDFGRDEGKKALKTEPAISVSVSQSAFAAFDDQDAPRTPEIPAAQVYSYESLPGRIYSYVSNRLCLLNVLFYTSSKRPELMLTLG